MQDSAVLCVINMIALVHAVAPASDIDCLCELIEGCEGIVVNNVLRQVDMEIANGEAQILHALRFRVLIRAE